MSNSSSKTLSPAELAKLEHAFAADPSSEAYKPLAEAYLGMGRFMEAMVVCKKGVKAHPNHADPRLLLSRVYAQQGKDKKALEEALGALQVQPADKQALRMAGALQLKTGEAEAGKAHLLKAWELDSSDAETLALLQQYKVEPPKPAAAAPVTPAPAPVAAPTPAPVASTPAPVETSAPVAAPAPSAAPAAPRPAPVEPVAPRPRPQVEQAPARPVARRPAYEEADEGYDDDDEPVSARRKPGSNRSLIVTLSLGVGMLLVLGGYWAYGSWAAKRNREIRKQLEASSAELKHDAYAAYKKAAEAADKALDVEPDSAIAHSYLAYAYAVLWGEHGGGDDARRKAEDHLSLAKKGGGGSQYLFAADALVQAYGGKAKEALGPLEAKVKEAESKGAQQELLYLTLGLIQMNLGDLEHARDNLEKAQAQAPDNPRIYAALGSLYRRRGQDGTAWKNYDFSLRYERNHPESLLGRSLLMLEQDEPNYAVAAEMLKKLLEAEPPPSPRQLAASHLARSLLVSRVSEAMGSLKPDVQAKLSEATGVPQEKDKARAELQKEEETGFALDKQSPELLLIKGRRLMLEGNTDGAIDEMRKAIKQDGTRAQFYVELAKALMNKQGGEKEASEALVTALKTMGDSPKLVLMLGNAYRRQGKVDDALAQYARAVKDPKAKNPEARLAMGTLYRERQEWAKAREALEKAAQEFVGQPDRTAMALVELGRVYEGQGDRTKADETYQRALNADEDYAPAYYFYAAFLSKDRKQSSKSHGLAQEYLRREPKGEHAADAQRL